MTTNNQLIAISFSEHIEELCMIMKIIKHKRTISRNQDLKLQNGRARSSRTDHFKVHDVIPEYW